MILGEHKPSAGRTTFDDVFRRAAERRPDALALVDAPDRMETQRVAPRSLTYAQADRMVSAIAGRLRRIGLSSDAIVAFQMPNNIDGILTLLGILRGGMIAAPLPILWRRAECVTALSRIGAKALIACGQYRGTDHCDVAMQVAAEIFPIRFVCGFGADLAEGVIPLNELYTVENLNPLPEPGRERQDNPAAHVALVTFDVTSDGLIAVARTHLELLSAAAAVVVESRIEQDAKILSTISPSSLAGISAGLAPWLFSGGTLFLHEPFSPDVFAQQIGNCGCDTVVLPGVAVARFAEAGLLRSQDRLKNILAVWRAPERLASSATWRNLEIATSDISVFGETAVIAGRRGPDGKPALLPLGPVMAPHGGPSAVKVAQTVRTDTGTLAVRGPMVPRYAFPPEAERTSIPAMRIASDGMVNTGYTCRIEHAGALVVTGPPSGIAGVGGYRFGLKDLQELVTQNDGNATLAALPDAMTGLRLAGQSDDRAAMRHVLTEAGVNPLVVRAFRDRAQPDAA